MALDVLTKLIHRRRSIFPKVFTGERIADDVILQLLENANQAPSHKHTEPWRFHVFSDEQKNQLGTFFQNTYAKHVTGDAFKESKHSKFLKKANASSHIIAICMQRDEEESIPEWEEIAAVACAVQNIYLSLTAAGLGGYWSTPGLMMEHIGEFIEMNKGERCLGFFYCGVPKSDMILSVKKKPLASKTRWYK